MLNTSFVGFIAGLLVALASLYNEDSRLSGKFNEISEEKKKFLRIDRHTHIRKLALTADWIKSTSENDYDDDNEDDINFPGSHVFFFFE